MADISKITIPNGSGGTITYDIKDAVARAAITAGLTFHIAVDAATTPRGVTWDDGGTTITGTLDPDNTTTGFYLVPSSHTATKDSYDEYVTVIIGGSGTEQDPYQYAWERLGNTEIDFTNLASYLDTTVTPTKDEVLGSATTFSNSSSSVTFTGGGTDTFVKSYPGATSKMSTTSVLGVKSNTTTASKATAGTAVSVAKVASSATNVSYVGNASTTSVLATASVNGEILTFGAASVSQGSVTGTNGTASITPYSFEDVTVPIQADAETTVATGSLASNGAGATVMTGLGTATTASAVTSLGTGTAAAQTITVGTNDKVNALTDVAVQIIDAA